VVCGAPGDNPGKDAAMVLVNALSMVKGPRAKSPLKTLLSLVRDVYDIHGWAVSRPDLPILFIAGADDPVTLGEKAWNDAQGFLRDRGYRNVSGKLYPGMRHEILNEEGAQEVFDDVLTFVEEACGV